MKITWAFEPSGLSKNNLKTMYSLIQKLQGTKNPPKIVHVEGEMYPGGVSPLGSFTPMLNTRDAQKDVTDALRKAGLRIPLKNIQLSNTSVASTSAIVARTLDMVTANKNQVIALFTKASTGFDRLVLGSFAETMIHRSHLDLLLSNPKMKWSGKIKTILYLDDFSETSKKHLAKVLSLSKQQKARLLVMHTPHITYEYDRWAQDVNNAEIAKYRRLVEQRKLSIEKSCSTAGVDCSVIWGDPRQEVHQSAFEIARKNQVDLIVVVAKTGAVGALLGGSTTRKIIRGSQVPVFVQKNPNNIFKLKLAGVTRQTRNFGLAIDQNVHAV